MFDTAVVVVPANLKFDNVDGMTQTVSVVPIVPLAAATVLLVAYAMLILYTVLATKVTAGDCVFTSVELAAVMVLIKAFADVADWFDTLTAEPSSNPYMR